MDNKQRIEKLQNELNALRAAEKKRLKVVLRERLIVAINGLTEMEVCDFRDMLLDHIHRAYHEEK